MEAIRRAFGMDTLKQDLDRLKEQTGNLDGAIEELKASVKRIHAARKDCVVQADNKLETWGEAFVNVSKQTEKQMMATNDNFKIMAAEKDKYARDFSTVRIDVNVAIRSNNYILGIIYTTLGQNRHHYGGNESKRESIERSALRKAIQEVANTAVSYDISPTNKAGVAPSKQFPADTGSGARGDKDAKSMIESKTPNDQLNLQSSSRDSLTRKASARFALGSDASDKNVTVTIPKKFKELGAILVDDADEIVNGEINARLRIVGFRSKGEKGCLAEQCGLRVNDIIGGVNGSTANTTEELVTMIAEACLGKKKSLVLYLPLRAEAKGDTLASSPRVSSKSNLRISGRR
jgi:hypothetical protein